MNQRRYNSPIRDRQAASTRRSILQAARRLFAEQGYASTSIAQIAQAAGVSNQTLYNSVGGKPALLLALNDLVDELAEVPLLQQRIATSEDPDEVLRLAVRIRRQLMERAGDIYRGLAAAAPLDGSVARALAEGLARSRAGTAHIAERLAELRALRKGLDVPRAAESLYALLHHDLWSRLVDECGWSPAAYEDWCYDLLRHALLSSASPRTS